MNDSLVAADREQIAIVGESHWTVTARVHVALGNGPQLRDRFPWFR
jgi:hypothetical protein